MASLGVNIDHIANVREARQTNEPDPVTMAYLAELGGADGITIHLREDRRHIQDRDLKLLRETLKSKLNLEIAATQEMIDIAIINRPDMVTIVPEKRKEITTEGGLNVLSEEKYLADLVQKLQESGIAVSIFIDPVPDQIEACSRIKAKFIELHTGKYAESSKENKYLEISKIKEATIFARNLDLIVNAGHGLTYQNVEAIARIDGIEELNIGHTIISRSIAVGLKEAVSEMKKLIINPRNIITS